VALRAVGKNWGGGGVGGVLGEVCWEGGVV